MPRPKKMEPASLHESPLVQAETRTYVANQKRADFYKNIGSYMFWGATAILGGVALMVLNPPAAGIILFGSSVPVVTATAIGLAASAATFVGSIVFSRKATEISERSNVLYSDIDSQHQARRMVQAFARAQVKGRAANDEPPFVEEGTNTQWRDFVGGRKPVRANGWAECIAREADAEEARELAGFSGRGRP